jgi:hypothetical protein
MWDKMTRSSQKEIDPQIINILNNKESKFKVRDEVQNRSEISALSSLCVQEGNIKDKPSNMVCNGGAKTRNIGGIQRQDKDFYNH